MIAFETRGVVDKNGFLTIEHPIALRNRKVRVLVLLQEDQENTEWLQAISSIPAFNFLADAEEDIYSLNDGFELTDER